MADLAALRGSRSSGVRRSWNRPQRGQIGRQFRYVTAYLTPKDIKDWSGVESTIGIRSLTSLPNRRKQIDLAVNEAFTISFFDLDGRVSSDVRAETR